MSKISDNLTSRQFHAIDSVIDTAIETTSFYSNGTDTTMSMGELIEYVIGLESDLVMQARELAIAFGMSKEYKFPGKKKVK